VSIRFDFRAQDIVKPAGRVREGAGPSGQVKPKGILPRSYFLGDL
jgi:hypothetical protein